MDLSEPFDAINLNHELLLAKQSANMVLTKIL